MDAPQAFSAFVALALTPERASRFSGLAFSAKGQGKLLRMLDHDFERAFHPHIKRGVINRKMRCYAFHSSTGFGEEFASVADAYNRLSNSDGWLIVVSDGSAGIYRPEAHWDAEVEIIA